MLLEPTKTKTLQQRIDAFDAYFRSANSVPPNARTTVPTQEWLDLKAALDAKADADIPEGLKAAGYGFMVNGTRFITCDEIPPEDAFDEDSLVELFTRKVDDETLKAAQKEWKFP